MQTGNDKVHSRRREHFWGKGAQKGTCWAIYYNTNALKFFMMNSMRSGYMRARLSYWRKRQIFPGRPSSDDLQKGMQQVEGFKVMPFPASLGFNHIIHLTVIALTILMQTPEIAHCKIESAWKHSYAQTDRFMWQLLFFSGMWDRVYWNSFSAASLFTNTRAKLF